MSKGYYCSNCGAVLEENIQVCPYCGYENEELAQAEQDEALEIYEEMTKDLGIRHHKVVKRSSRYVLIVGICIFMLFVLGVLLAWGVSSCQGDNSLETQRKELAKLEDYYASRDYGAMTAYMNKLGYRGNSYEKYKRVADRYDNMDWRIEAIISESEFISKIDLETEDVARAMSYAFEEMVQIKIMEEEGFIYGEEAGLIYIWERYVDAFKTYMHLTDDEINATVAKGMEAYLGEDYDGDDVTPYEEAADIAIDRIKN